MTNITKKELGQYFTTSTLLQQFVYDVVKYKDAPLLEPAFGIGHLLQKFIDYNENYPMTLYEIDNTITPMPIFNEYQEIKYVDFMTNNNKHKFKTIIGNPPYVKGKKTSNLYLKFIEKCYHMLASGGELIFIVPSDFIKVTSAAKIIDLLVSNGSFTNFLFPHDEKLFMGASIDIMVFRYEKDLFDNTVIVNDEKMKYAANKGIITFHHGDLIIKGPILSDIFNIYVGIVSGLDKVYKSSFGNIEVLSDLAITTKFIFPEAFPTGTKEIDDLLIANKSALLSRRIKKFSESNWHEWGAPRNIKQIRLHWGKSCIYVKTITRKKIVAFIDIVQYFSGSLLCMIPKNNMSIDELENIVAFLNNDAFISGYLYAGRFKIGHKQLCNVMIL